MERAVHTHTHTYSPSPDLPPVDILEEAAVFVERRDDAARAHAAAHQLDGVAVVR